jgi:hypothetical protein
LKYPDTAAKQSVLLKVCHTVDQMLTFTLQKTVAMSRSLSHHHTLILQEELLSGGRSSSNEVVSERHFLQLQTDAVIGPSLDKEGD